SYLGSHFRGHRLNGLGTSALIRGNAGSSPAGRTIRTTEDGRRRTDDCSLLRRPSSVLRRLLQGVAQLGSAPGPDPGGRWFEPNRPDHFGRQTTDDRGRINHPSSVLRPLTRG